MAFLQGLLEIFVKQMDENTKAVRAVELVLHKTSNTEYQLAASLQAGQGTNEQLDDHEKVTPRRKLETPETGVAHMTSCNECETMYNQRLTQKATPEVRIEASGQTKNLNFEYCLT